MGVPAAEPLHARHRDGSRGRHDPGNAPAHDNAGRHGARLRYLISGLLCWLLAVAAQAETVRIATFSPELSRKGPGLLLRDILKGKDDQIAASLAVIAETDPDILLLTGFDYDAGNAALEAFADKLAEANVQYPYRFSLRPNSGMATGLDMDGNGRVGEPRDAQGYGRFAGQGGMALLSRFPIAEDDVRDFSSLLWKDLPGASLPQVGGTPFPSAKVLDVQRLSTTGHWLVPVRWPGRDPLTLMAFAATPPIFDGPEDRNGLRNADEIGLWLRLLDGQLSVAPPERAFVVLGNANLDPFDGDGRTEVIGKLLADPRMSDPRPGSAGAAASADPEHDSEAALDTAEWRAVTDGGPGNLRVDYVLPSADLPITGAGVHWPSGGTALETARTASRHRLVWVDVVVVH